MDFTTFEVSDDSSSPNSKSFVEISTDTSVAFSFHHGSELHSHDSDSDSANSLASEDEKELKYEEIMQKYEECGEELRITTLKLQESEQEIEKLKSKVQNKESEVEFLRGEFETALREIDTKDIAIETKEMDIIDVKMQVIDLETDLSYSKSKYDDLVNEFEMSRGLCDAAFVENLQLKELLFNYQKNSSNIAWLLANQSFLESQVSQTKEHFLRLEEYIRNSDAEKLEMQMKEVELQGQINALKTDLACRGEDIEALNMNCEMRKLGYDMLMAEKDGVCSELAKLKDGHQKDRLLLDYLFDERFRLESELGEAKKKVEELRARVQELEKKAKLQRNPKNTVEELRDTIKEELENQSKLQRNAKNTVEELGDTIKEELELENLISEGDSTTLSLS